MKSDKLYNEIIQAFWYVTTEEGEEKFRKLLDQHPLLKAIKDVDVDEVKKSFKSAVINKCYVALALDLTLQMGVNLKRKSLNSEPAVEIAGLLLEAKANPNDYVPLGYDQKATFFQDAISAHQDNNMIKVLLSKSTYPIDLLTVFPYFQLALLDRKPACPVQAWHLFIAGAALGENLIALLGKNALIKQVVCENNISIFIFLQAIYKYHVRQRREPVVAKELLKFFPTVLVPIIQEFSDDCQKTTDQIATEMSVEFPEWQQKPLDELNTFTAAVENKLDMDKIRMFFSQGVPQQCRKSPNEEIKVGDLSIQPLMLLSELGEEDGVKVLLESKADPTMSINGSFAFTWAIASTWGIEPEELGGTRKVEKNQRYTNIAMSIFSRLLEEVSPDKQSKPLGVISKGFGQSCIIA